MQPTDSNFMESLYWKNNQLESSNVTKKAIDKFCVCNISYHLRIYEMMAGQKIKEISKQNKTKLKNINCSPH